MEKPVYGSDISANRRRNAILKIIRENPGQVGKTAFQRMTRMGMESTILLVNKLLSDGLIREAGRSNAPAGRKATLYNIDPEGCYFIGLRFSAGNIWALVINFNLETIISRKRNLREGLNTQGVIDELEDCLSDLLDELGDRKERLAGIGISAPGLVDSVAGIGRRYVHIADWENVPLKQIIEDKFAIPVFVEGSIKCLAYALKESERSVSLKDMLLVQLGRGIGMAMILNGEIYQGATHISGGIGHIHISDAPVLCECGKKGCLEAMAGLTAMRRSIAEGLPAGRFTIMQKTMQEDARIDLDSLCRAADMGDQDILDMFAEAAVYIGKAIAIAVSILNPQRVVVAGEPARLPAFSESLRRSVRENCFTESVQTLDLICERYDDAMGALGSALLVFRANFGE